MAASNTSSPPRANGDPTSSEARTADRYRALLHSLDDGFCVVDVLLDPAGVPHDYRFIEVNRSFTRETGLVDPVGKRMRELAPKHEDAWFERYGQVALTGQPARFVLQARALGERWFEVHAARVDRPEQLHVAVLFRDISDRVRAERDSRFLAAISRDLLRLDSESELSTAIAARVAEHFGLSQCAFVELDASTRLARVGSCWHQPGIASLSGTYLVDEFIVGDFWPRTTAGEMLVIEDVHRDDRIAHQERFTRLRIGSFVTIPLRRGTEWRYLFALYRQSPSTWRPDELELAAEVAARCWTRIERLRAEEALRLSEERLRLVVENARDYVIFSADLERRITSWNAGAERILGYTGAEVVGQTADIIFTAEDRERGAPLLECTLALRDGRAADERWHQRKDGTRLWGSGVMMAMRDRNGAVCGLLKIMRDQTEREVSRQALERSQREAMAALAATEQARATAVAAGRAKDQFLAALSHELRTPLNPVLMVASDAATDPDLPPDIRASFELVRKNIELEARLIDDMLDLSRITQGKLTWHGTDVDLHDMIRSAVEMTRPAALEKGIEPVVRLDAGRMRVHGDPARLQQIFVNLLNNAIKFTPAGGHVAVESEERGDADEIRVRIMDTGIGLTEEERLRIFQPFAQGSHAGAGGSPVYGGLGLGLAIVDELATRHHGRVTASSEGRGRGATFTVELPLATARPAADAAGPGARVVRPGPPLHILLVEDHPSTRATVERILARRNHDIVSAGTFAQARAAAAGRRFDLLISDLGLPDGDGCDLFRELRRSQPHLRAIALSGFGMESDLRRTAAAGFSAHLVKPISVAKLDAVISQLEIRPET